MSKPIVLSAEDTAIEATTWGDAETSQFGVLLIHGLGAHSRWFDPLANSLSAKNIFCLAHDQLGFGKRRKQQFVSHKQWVEDACTTFRQLRQMMAGRPAFLLGNSMGAVVAFHACPAANPSGLVMLSPGFEGYPDAFPLPFRANVLLKTLVNADSEVDLPYRVDLVTSNKELQREIENDPDKRFRLPARMLFELLLLTMNPGYPIKSIEQPVLMLTSGLDKVVDNKVSAAVFEKLRSRSKRAVRFENSWHDLVFDQAVDDVAVCIANWMAEVAASKSTAEASPPAS